MNCATMIQQKALGYNTIFRDFLRKHPFAYLGIVLLGIVSILFSSVSPLLIRSLIDDVLLGNNRGLLIPILVGLSLIIVLSAIANYFSGIIRGKLTILHYNELSTGIFQSIQHTTQQDIQQIRIGDLQTRSVSNSYNVIQTAVNTIPQLFITILRIFFPLIIMFSLDPYLSFFVIIPIILYVLSSWYFGKKIRHFQRPVLDSGANLQSFLNESYSYIPLIKVFNLEVWNEQRYRHVLSDYSEASLGAVKISSQNTAATLIIDGIPSLIVFTVGSIEYLNGSISLGTLTAFLAYVGLFFSPIEQISMLWSNYAASQASYDRIEELLLLEKHTYGTKGEITFPEKVELRNVSFSIGTRKILENCSVTFTRGVNYIIGDNGSGKTTLCYLLCGLYAPENGDILIDGNDLSAFTREALRSMISVVFSEPMIFNGTVYENIRIGKTSASHEEIIAAARKAEIDDYIMTLPKQYNTIIGESGLNLSSGEMQKIALARAILRDTPIIILDEFTRSIDLESKMQIQKITNAMPDKIIIIITHDMTDISSEKNVITLEKCCSG